MPGPNDARNIFICDICCIGFEILWSFYAGLVFNSTESMFKQIEDLKDDEDVKTEESGQGKKNDAACSVSYEGHICETRT